MAEKYGYNGNYEIFEDFYLQAKPFILNDAKISEEKQEEFISFMNVLTEVGSLNTFLERQNIDSDLKNIKTLDKLKEHFHYLYCLVCDKKYFELKDVASSEFIEMYVGIALKYLGYPNLNLTYPQNADEFSKLRSDLSGCCNNKYLQGQKQFEEENLEIDVGMEVETNSRPVSVLNITQGVKIPSQFSAFSSVDPSNQPLYPNNKAFDSSNEPLDLRIRGIKRNIDGVPIYRA